MRLALVRIAILALGMLTAGLRSAEACRCVDPGPPCQAYWNTDVIFRGRAESIGRPADRSVDPRQFVIVRFTILEPFKGVEGATIDVRTPTGPASCALRFTKGREYLVHGSRVDDVVTTSACSRTRRVERAADDLGYARSVAAGGVPLGRISGRVVLRLESLWSRGDYTRPMADVPVTLRRGHEFGLMVRTDRSGQFMANGLEPGTYTVDVAPAGRFRVEAPAGVTLADARGCAVVNVAIYPAGRLAGRVVESSGAPIRGLAVDLSVPPEPGRRARPPVQTVTRQDGRFEFLHVPAGQFVVGINTTDDLAHVHVFHPGVTHRADATLVSMPPGGEVELQDLVVPPDIRFVEIAGVVYDAERIPVEGARVYLRGPDDGDYILTAPAITDRDGHFTIAALDGAEYLLFAERSSQEPGGHVGSTDLVPVLASSTHTRLTLTLRSPR